MSLKLLKGLALGSILTFTMLISTSVFACDDKSCETAYLAETQQHIANQVRRANTYKTERHAYSKNRERRAYSKNRERRAYATFVRKHFIWEKYQLAQVL